MSTSLLETVHSSLQLYDENDGGDGEEYSEDTQKSGHDKKKEIAGATFSRHMLPVHFPVRRM